MSQGQAPPTIEFSFWGGGGAKNIALLLLNKLAIARYVTHAWSGRGGGMYSNICIMYTVCTYTKRVDLPFF